MTVNDNETRNLLARISFAEYFCGTAVDSPLMPTQEYQPSSVSRTFCITSVPLGRILILHSLYNLFQFTHEKQALFLN